MYINFDDFYFKTTNVEMIDFLFKIHKRQLEWWLWNLYRCSSCFSPTETNNQKHYSNTKNSRLKLIYYSNNKPCWKLSSLEYVDYGVCSKYFLAPKHPMKWAKNFAFSHMKINENFLTIIIKRTSDFFIYPLRLFDIRLVLRSARVCSFLVSVSFLLLVHYNYVVTRHLVLLQIDMIYAIYPIYDNNRDKNPSGTYRMHNT